MSPTQRLFLALVFSLSFINTWVFCFLFCATRSTASSGSGHGRLDGLAGWCFTEYPTRSFLTFGFRRDCSGYDFTVQHLRCASVLTRRTKWCILAFALLFFFLGRELEWSDRSVCTCIEIENGAEGSMDMKGF
ncbi:hypothetical protein K402DRAFT_233622 [Aulographum hederae CBS 113979]|uniref:Uncharacterized protein n=1 Tax=Aulographum hederae CBS 113979 TaxID=1176131 RepID=A0A6G1GL71_9PEZI|nr:hypothetical protein K402DRAFT_233622 [Aulographum hederae CBS 113979]